MLPLWLPKCYHMVHSLPLSPMDSLALSPSLSPPVTGAVFDCSPDKRELYDLSPRLAVLSPGLILKPNCSASSPLRPIPLYPPPCSCRGRLFSGRKWIAPRWAQEPERSWERGEPPTQARPAASRWGNVGERLSDTRINLTTLHHTAWLTACPSASALGPEPGNRLCNHHWVGEQSIQTGR